MATVALGIPHAGDVRPAFSRRLLEIQNNCSQHGFIYVEVDTMIIGKARTIIVNQVVNELPEVDVLAFVDDDVLLPHNAGVLIDNALELGVVSGVYHSKAWPYLPQMYTEAVTSEGLRGYEAIIEYPESGFIRADAVGAGCLFIKMDIYRQLDKAFKDRTSAAMEYLRKRLQDDKYGLTNFEWLTEYSRNLSPWFEFLDMKGEDFYLCERLRENGNTIWVNLDVQCGHIGEVEVTADYFKQVKDSGVKFEKVDLHGNPIPIPEVRNEDPNASSSVG